jgi:predicted GNAT superfamily acetyltransferase
MTQDLATPTMKPMTDLRAPHGDSAVDEAVAAADAAARAAGTRVRQLETLPELEAVQRLYEGIWRPEGKNPPVTTELLRALTKAGSYVGGAFHDDDLVGACVGFFAPPATGALHSHIAGVDEGMRGHSVGFALKLHQRAWALLRGVAEIEWTFDPLVRRNAHFNLGKLAAQAVEYLPNFYGRMDDGINGADDTDRLLVSWQLAAAEVAAACAGQHRGGDAAAARADGAEVVLDVSANGGPLAVTPTSPTVLVAVPEDIERLRRIDPGCASAWRVGVRETLGGLLAEGARITGFDRSGWYIVDRKDASS